MDEIIEKVEYMLHKRPDKVAELIKHMYHHDPQAVERMLDYPEDAEHISNRRKYEELVERLRWESGNGRGAKWSLDDIKKNSKIDFQNEDYTEFDYAYLVNSLYAKCCKYITDPSLLMKLAKCLLEDKDEETKIYRGHNYNKSKYNQRGTQDYYNDYSEENRRRRRYRSQSDTDFYEDNRHYNYTNDYENRRSYNYERDDGNRYYRDSHVGFTR